MADREDGRAAVLAGSFAVAGALKLLGLEKPLFRRWGYSGTDMRLVGAIEAGGAALVANPSTRGVGALTLLAVSVAMLRTEARNGDLMLALPRTALLLIAAATALDAGQRNRA